MGNCSPQISVIMGTLYLKKDLALLSRSVESVLDQSFPDFEFLICDDGSDEPARKLLDYYSAKDERVRLVRPGEKRDLSSKLNACLLNARGTYIARMDDDDYSHRDRFIKQLDILKQYPDIGFAGSNVFFCKNQVVMGSSNFPERPTIQDFYFSQPFIHPALMFRKRALDSVDGYCEEDYCNLCEDYDLLLRLYANGHYGINIQEPLLDYSVSFGRGKRSMRHRWHEVQTRFRRYSELGVLSSAWPYVVKPLAVGLIPDRLLTLIRNRRFR